MGILYLQLPWQPAGPRYLYRSRHHIPPVTAAGKAHFFWMLFYDWTSGGKSSEKWQKAASIWVHFWGTPYPSKVSSRGEKWQGLMLVLCQGKSPESESQPSKEILMNYKVVLFPFAVEQDLSCPPHACLFLWLWGLAMPWPMEKKPGVFLAVLAKIQGEAPQSLCQALSYWEPPVRGRLTGPLLMRWLVATSSIFWEILGQSFRQTKLEDRIICALICLGYWHWSMFTNKLWRRGFSSDVLCSLSLRNLQFLLSQWLQEKELGEKQAFDAQRFFRFQRFFCSASTQIQGLPKVSLRKNI